MIAGRSLSELAKLIRGFVQLFVVVAYKKTAIRLEPVSKIVSGRNRNPRREDKIRVGVVRCYS